jgi:exopolysaccharide biosynthesis predicted pyruvyltransferase EpsI
MKTAVISHPSSINLGDEVQSIAARRLLNNVDHYIDRENTHKFTSDEHVKLLCNGWFMGNANNWPPSDCILPLFISMHISSANGTASKIFTPSNIKYFKKHEPIGCRDHGTKRLFEKHGIEAYFSNCLTLTLERDAAIKRDNSILIVDAFRTNYDASFRKYYEQNIVPKAFRKNVKYIEQRNTERLTVEERFEKAEELIELYSKARLVITSRIHCALPCIALGTPVYFVHAGYHNLEEGLQDRFEGILELFDVVDESRIKFASSSFFDRFVRKLHLYKLFNKELIDIDWNLTPSTSKEKISKYVENQKKIISDFFKEKI